MTKYFFKFQIISLFETYCFLDRALAADAQSCHAGEFHPHVPTEPYVKVSLHTALHAK